MSQSTAPSASDLERLFRLYGAKAHDSLSEEFLNIFEHFTRTVYLNESSIRGTLVPFLKVFLTLFTQPDYVISARYGARFVIQNTLIANLTAMSPFRTTDAFLELLGSQPSNFVKVLTLYSARNNIRIGRRQLFDADPELASLWYNLFCDIYKSGLVHEDVVRHLNEHLSYRDERMTDGPGLDRTAFSCTYVDGDRDRDVKRFLNHLFRRRDRFTWQNQARRDKIAIISDNWLPNHSVYRNYAAFVKALRPAYHLTFFHILTARESLDVSMFDEVHQLHVHDGVFHVEPLLSNDFQVVYFPDVGMTQPSLHLANYRMAPIQLCSPGHSVSTWGAEIDYFISGADVEIVGAPERNYSERLVLLPGMGVIHNRPLYQRTGAKKQVPEIVINGPWSGHKIHFRFLSTLRKLLDRAARPVRLRIFPGIGISENNAHGSFLADLRAALGTAVALEVWPHLPYAEYMRMMEEGDLNLDSFHFAGCNTIADSLFLHKPTVVWEGDKWYNRIGSAMLRLVGLDEFICTTEQQYLDKALLLICNDEKRAEVTAQLQSVDLDARLFSTEHAPAFRRAVDYLIASHQELSKQERKSPIMIS